MNDVDNFSKYLMQSIKSDFMFRAKAGRKTYSMEEVLWIVHEDIEECALMYDYEGKPENRKPDIRIPITVDKISKPLEFTDPDPYDATSSCKYESIWKDVKKSFDEIAEFYRNEVKDGE